MSGSPLRWKDLKAQHAELKKVLQVGLEQLTYGMGIGLAWTW